jgi:protein required for attachment to host cells
VEQTDWHDEAERAFLHGLAAHLDTAVRAGETKALIIVAPPRALGMLRKAYTASIRGVLRQEIDKDLVKVPIYEIEKHLLS